MLLVVVGLVVLGFLCLFLVCFLNVLATGSCTKGTDVLRQMHVLLDSENSCSHSIQTAGQPVPALTLQRHAPDRVAVEETNFKSLV